MSGASTKTSSTQSNTIDPSQMARFTQNYDTALGVANRPFQPYTGEMVAGSNPALDQGYSMIGNIANNNTGASTLNSGIDAVKSLSGDLSPFMNPYQQGVINTTMSDLERQRQMAQMGDAQAATAAGAFGGSRSGVMGALTNEAYDRNAASTLAGLNAQNYSNAQNVALQSGSALGALSDQQLQQALSRAGAMTGAGTQQQGIQQALDDARYQEFLRQWMYPDQQQQLRNQALGLIPLQQTVTGTGTQKSNVSFNDIMNGIGRLASSSSGGAG
jgi:hypothetical protein